MQTRNYLMIVVLLTLPLALSGCAKDRLEIQTIPTTKARLNLPSPDEVLLNPVRWLGLSKNVPPGERGSIEYFWKQMKSRGYTTGVALSPADFRKLSANNAKLRKYILQQKSLIRAYRNYYEANK